MVFAASEDQITATKRIKSETFTSHQMNGYPMAKPWPLLGISEETAVELMSGAVTLLWYLDWPKFGEMAHKLTGLSFTLSDHRQVEADYRRQGLSGVELESIMPIATSSGVPTLENEVGTFYVGPPSMFRMMSDLENPSVLAREFAEPFSEADHIKMESLGNG